VPGSL